MHVVKNPDQNVTQRKPLPRISACKMHFFFITATKNIISHYSCIILFSSTAAFNDEPYLTCSRPLCGSHEPSWPLQYSLFLQTSWWSGLVSTDKMTDSEQSGKWEWISKFTIQFILSATIHSSLEYEHLRMVLPQG